MDFLGKDPHGNYQVGTRKDDQTVEIYLCKEPCTEVTVQNVDKSGAILRQGTEPLPKTSVVNGMLRDAMAGKLKVMPSSALTAAAPSPSFSPSFDCAKARSDSEKLICGDAALAALDVQAARYYSQAKIDVASKLPGRSSDLAAEQQGAWRQRESDCHDRDCLLTWYQDRLAKLAGWEAEALAAK